MLTLHDIYSRVANEISDHSFVLMTRGEYFIIANQVALFLSRYIELYVRNIEYKATAEVEFFEVPTALSAVEVVPLGVDLITQPVGDHYKVNKFLKVVRHNQDCREVSWQAIESANRGNAAFKVNDSQLDFRFYATRLLPNGNLQLHWVVPIAIDEVVNVFALCDFLVEANYATTTFETSVSTPKWSEFKDFTPIPDLIAQTFYTHFLVEVFASLLNKKGDEFANKLMMAKDRAKRELYELRRYIASLKSKDSVGQIQPFKWLSEDGGSSTYSRDISNIPPEWTTTIIL